MKLKPSTHTKDLAAKALGTILLLVALAGAGCDEYTQIEQDRDTLLAFRVFFNRTWNDNIAGGNSGGIDFTLTGTDSDCGTLHVTGQVQSDGATYTLLYAFDHYCLSVSAGSSLRLKDVTGEISVGGVITGEMVYNSDDLAVDGVVKNDEGDSAQLDSELDMESTSTPTSGSGSVNGRKTVSWGNSGGGGGGGDCDLYAIDCGSVSGGIEVVGGVVPAECNCPDGTYLAGVDNVTEGGPYNICTCNGY